MHDVSHYFRGKRITLMGLGLLGRGVGDAAFLAGCGADVVVTDKKTEAELAQSVEQLKKYPNISFHLGGHRIEDFTRCHLVIKAAGVRLDSPEIAAAKKAGVAVAMSTALFAKYAAEEGGKIIGVTGTRGKSTIAHMLYHTLKGAGKDVYLGGNVRGVSTLALLPKVHEGDIVVLELDSWQLQGFGELEISPHVSVFSNLMPDHQNYYTDLESYFHDKANIFKYQKNQQGDALLVGAEIAPQIRAAHPPVEPIVPEALPATWQLKILGEHNRENAALAAAALFVLGLSADEIQKGLESFEGVEGRLQLVAEKNGIKIYNDNNATTPEATIAAIKALDDGNPPSPKASEGRRKNIILIMGGSDKGLDMSVLVDNVQGSCKQVFLLAGTGTNRIKSSIQNAPIYESVGDVVGAAFKSAESGDVILFSPAFASFGMFENEYDRGDQFLKLVRSL